MKRSNSRSKLKKKKMRWDKIDWLKVNKFVSSMQRVVEVAYIMNDTERVFELQEKLIMSWYARVLAVRRVTSNKGSKTLGMNGKLWRTHKDKWEASSYLREILLSKEKYYRVGYVKRVYIPKPNSIKGRPLGIPNLTDRALQTLITFAINPTVEHKSDLHSYGSRIFKGVWDAMLRLRTLLDKPTSPRWVWDVDISDCFNQISHEFLRKEVSQILYPKGSKLVNKWLKAEILENGSVTIPKKGIPQGGVISPLLCNIVLNGLENIIRKGYPGHHNAPAKLNLTGIYELYVM